MSRLARVGGLVGSGIDLYFSAKRDVPKIGEAIALTAVGGAVKAATETMVRTKSPLLSAGAAGVGIVGGAVAGAVAGNVMNPGWAKSVTNAAIRTARFVLDR